MNEAFFLLGSNLGDRLNYLSTATDYIEQKIGKIFRKSSVYETEPFGNMNQPYYLNQVVSILSDCSPNDLLDIVMNIEKSMGRIRKQKWEERNIDIDILFYGVKIINEPNLKIPHPEIEFRSFTLVPLKEIIPFFVHPLICKKLYELLFNIDDKLQIRLYNDVLS
jgi:2-amino-4-hydroxy-6-hydroxymethyldihydropteridine diphosphokinase